MDIYHTFQDCAQLCFCLNNSVCLRLHMPDILNSADKKINVIQYCLISFEAFIYSFIYSTAPLLKSAAWGKELAFTWSERLNI